MNRLFFSFALFLSIHSTSKDDSFKYCYIFRTRGKNMGPNMGKF